MGQVTGIGQAPALDPAGGGTPETPGPAQAAQFQQHTDDAKKASSASSMGAQMMGTLMMGMAQQMLNNSKGDDDG